MSVDPWAPVTPAFQHVPAWDFTAGPEVADLCALLGFVPMPEQEQWLDAVFAVRSSDGLPACSDLTEIAARQNLKTGEFVMTALGWLFITKEDRILWSAHEFATAKEGFLQMQKLLEGKSWTERRVRRFYSSASFMGIVMNDGRRIEFAARTTSQGRGKSAPKAILDEGLELRPEHLGAQDAIKSTFPWAQTIIGSSACKPYSDVLRMKVDALREGRLGEREFAREFCDDLPGECERGPECPHVVGTSGCRLDDRERWKRSNPALGRIHPDGRGLTEAAIARERQNQPDPLIFARERLGWHDDLAASLVSPIDMAVWMHELDGFDAGSRIVDEPRVVLDVSPSRDRASLVAAGRNAAGLVHIEITSEDTDDGVVFDTRPGTAWILPRLQQMREGNTWFALTVIAGSAAEALKLTLENGGIDVDVIAQRDYAAACGHFLDLIAQRGLVHLGQPELTAAAAGAVRKDALESQFVWGRRKSSGDITPLVAATVGAWLASDKGGVGL